MKDIELDFDNKKIVNNSVSDQARIMQQIRVAVRSWMGDFFLNEQYGVDYHSCFGNMGLMKIFIKEQIEAINGVLSVQNIEIKQDKDNIKKPYIINATIKLDIGSINLLEEINY